MARHCWRGGTDAAVATAVAHMQRPARRSGHGGRGSGSRHQQHLQQLTVLAAATLLLAACGGGMLVEAQRPAVLARAPALQLSAAACGVDAPQLLPSACDVACRTATLDALAAIYATLDGASWNFDVSRRTKNLGGWMTCPYPSDGGCRAESV
jgi:hypothetical protein